MNSIQIVAIVEGQGEERAIDALIKRVAKASRPDCFIDMLKTVRKKRTELIPKKGELNRTEWESVIELAASKVSETGAILILLDADYECPKEMAPKMAQLISSIRSDKLKGLVLANTEYESWFVAAIESLSGKHGLREGLEWKNASKNAGKTWIENQMAPGKKYKATVDQLIMTRAFDLELARRRSDSFDKFYREVTRLIETLTKGSNTDA